MKVELKPSGYIVISCEDDTESYALRKWSEDNIKKCQGLLVDYSRLIDDTDVIKKRLEKLYEN